MNITLITSGSKARSTPACVITRGMTQAITATLLTEGGANVSTTGVAAWELGITQDFLAATGLLAATTTITAAGNVLTIALNGHTTEMAEYLDGKKAAVGFATLKGYDSGGDVIASYVWQVVLQNVGYDADTEAAHAIDGLFHTAAVVNAKFADIAGTVASDPAFAAMLAAKEDVANKTQAIDAADPSSDKYPSEAAVVAHVGGAVTDALGDIEAVLDELIGGAP